jgi:hypothetical protein
VAATLSLARSAEDAYNEMAEGSRAGFGRAAFLERGFAEWIHLVGNAARTGSSGKSCEPGKCELPGPANEIVVLLANITQEAI